MLKELFKSVFPDKNTREIKKLTSVVAQINSLEASVAQLSDSDFFQLTKKFRHEIQSGKSLDVLLPEVFACVREGAKRTLGQRHFDVQLMGGIVLHQGSIAEMRTGEGKTLVATLAAYLNALPEKGGVHIVTINDYLASRDANWMRPVYELLGMKVGIIVSGMETKDKQAAYAADIVYCTNNELGFDYLRDNMAFSLEDRVQHGRYFAIVDEVDSILIDEARTPLIISGPTSDNTELYQKINELIFGLERYIPPDDDVPTIKKVYDEDDEKDIDGHYILDEKNRHIELTENGHILIEERLKSAGLLGDNDSLYSTVNLILLHNVQAAMRAHKVFKRDVDYLVQNRKIVIVDEHTGRTMPGRRWSDGIHQAIEAKEGVEIEQETQTLASITFQNYFRQYEKLAGMTGTADTEAFEFRQIYDLDVVVIPTNRAMVRNDMNDLIYMTEAEKYNAIVADIRACVSQNRPVLVGTVSVQSSERLSQHLQKLVIPHSVLNAKNFESEAAIVAQAGKSKSVTIATNMAGRGTDIVLGGNWQEEIENQEDVTEKEKENYSVAWQNRHDAVLTSGGLHIIGTERHESRRIDNQLRGRSGRQGDLGSSRFYLSMEDSLIRLFIPERVRIIMQGVGINEGEAIEHKMLSRAIEKAQRKVEGRNFDIRKNLLEYDDVANEQRQLIYQQRDELMLSEDIYAMIQLMRIEVINECADQYIAPQSLFEQWNLTGLEEQLLQQFNSVQPLSQWLDDDDDMTEEKIRERMCQQIEDEYKIKEERVGPAQMHIVEKTVMLIVLDRLWKEHLANMDHLRQGIHLRAYAQKQPKQEYKRESFELFQLLLGNIRSQVISELSRIEINVNEGGISEAEKYRDDLFATATQDDSVLTSNKPEPLAVLTKPLANTDNTAPYSSLGENLNQIEKKQKKLGRNDPCHCGSGKKYKKCHGQEVIMRVKKRSTNSR